LIDTTCLIIRCKSPVSDITFLDPACWSRWRGHRNSRKAGTQPRGCGVGVMNELFDPDGHSYRHWANANGNETRVARGLSTRRQTTGGMYRGGRGHWSPGSSLSIERRGYALTIFKSELTEDDCREFCEQSATFALVIESPLLVLCHRFGTALPWSSTPYAYPLDSKAGRTRRVPSEILSGSRARLRVRLVDADCGVIRAQRRFVLSPQFTVALDDAVRQQACISFDGDDYLAAIVEISLGSVSASKLAQRATVRTASPR
jgi:hypothetical protein